MRTFVILAFLILQSCSGEKISKEEDFFRNFLSNEAGNIFSYFPKFDGTNSNLEEIEESLRTDFDSLKERQKEEKIVSFLNSEKYFELCLTARIFGNAKDNLFIKILRRSISERKDRNTYIAFSALIWVKSLKEEKSKYEDDINSFCENLAKFNYDPQLINGYSDIKFWELIKEELSFENKIGF